MAAPFLMRISHRHRFVFIAVPRTASTSMRCLLDKHSDIKSVHISDITDDFPFYHHVPASRLMEVFAEKGWTWDSYFRFCVVRNPFDRVVSLYHHHLTMIRKRFKAGVFGRAAHWWTKNPSFRGYVMSLGPANTLAAPLADYVCDGEGREQVNAVLQYEKLDTEMPMLAEKLGVAIQKSDMPRLNAADRRRHYRSYYDQDTRERVADIYQKEIARFGYEF